MTAYPQYKRKSTGRIYDRGMARKDGVFLKRKNRDYFQTWSMLLRLFVGKGVPLHHRDPDPQPIGR